MKYLILIVLSTLFSVSVLADPTKDFTKKIDLAFMSIKDSEKKIVSSCSDKLQTAPLKMIIDSNNKPQMILNFSKSYGDADYIDAQVKIFKTSNVKFKEAIYDLYTGYIRTEDSSYTVYSSVQRFIVNKNETREFVNSSVVFSNYNGEFYKNYRDFYFKIHKLLQKEILIQTGHKKILFDKSNIEGLVTPKCEITMNKNKSPVSTITYFGPAFLDEYAATANNSYYKANNNDNIYTKDIDGVFNAYNFHDEIEFEWNKDKYACYGPTSDQSRDATPTNVNGLIISKYEKENLKKLTTLKNKITIYYVDKDPEWQRLYDERFEAGNDYTDGTVEVVINGETKQLYHDDKDLRKIILSSKPVLYLVDPFERILTCQSTKYYYNKMKKY